MDIMGFRELVGSSAVLSQWLWSLSLVKTPDNRCQLLNGYYIPCEALYTGDIVSSLPNNL